MLTLTVVSTTWSAPIWRASAALPVPRVNAYTSAPIAFANRIA